REAEDEVGCRLARERALVHLGGQDVVGHAEPGEELLAPRRRGGEHEHRGMLRGASGAVKCRRHFQDVRGARTERCPLVPSRRRAMKAEAIPAGSRTSPSARGAGFLQRTPFDAGWFTVEGSKPWIADFQRLSPTRRAITLPRHVTA